MSCDGVVEELHIRKERLDVLSGSRIRYLDGLRGLAIVMVVFFHAYVRWPRLYPFGDLFVHDLWCAYGFLGVQLFFMISGFVIFMSMEKCAGLVDFLRRRWLRLFPAMLICSLIIFLSSHCFPNRPMGIPVFRDVIPGLFFVEPKWLEFVFGGSQGFLEGSLWSLYVEVRFYIVIGIVYFWFGSKRSLYFIPAAFLFYVVVTGLAKLIESNFLEFIHVSASVFFREYCWFGIGAFLYFFVKTQESRYYIYALMLSLVAMLVSSQWEIVIVKLFIIICFFGPLTSSRIRYFFENRLLYFFGAISYPLYLLHENMMISMTISLGDVAPKLPGILLPLAPILLVGCMAYIVANYLERRMKCALLKISTACRL